ncbi:hypothetical protein MMF93_15845 [Streptomyces tubbatahanensis]|uniref:Type II secretion system protein GspF domain-containing protein n=1 Tax=Streptomyces tubbatahanensis TaxID=2923272 RepID=A0ABY3XTR4_9ACTN|nr:hypothetical protein [Streptomyces tubbatahanensis]UNS97780.1 hypothetical protein MMF93_15845 [Streptomyces tubbatahanensis]
MRLEIAQEAQMRALRDIFHKARSLPIASDRKGDFLRCVMAAARRELFVRRRFSYLAHTPLPLALIIPCVFLVFFGNIRLLSFIMASVWLLLPIVMWSALSHKILKARIAYALTSALMVFIVAEAFSAPKLYAPWSGPLWAFLSVASLFAGLLIYARIWWACRVKSLESGCHDFDLVVVAGVRLAHAMNEERNDLASTSTARRWCGMLEGLAVASARALTLRSRADPGDAAIRRELHADGLRVAQLIRVHKHRVITARSVDDIDLIVTSLVEGTFAFALKDREALLANAPEAPTNVRQLRAIFWRVLPGLSFIGLAFLLPIFPMVAAHPEAAHALRVVFIGMGISLLVSSSPELAGRVGDVLSKAVPFK